jgi:hypothetical protein
MRKGTRRYYTKCGSFCGQRKNLKHSGFQEKESLLATWFKQAIGSSAVISGTLLRRKAVHIFTRLAIDLKASNGQITGFKQSDSVACKTVSGDYKSIHFLRWKE